MRRLSERRWSGATDAMTASRARESVPLAADEREARVDGVDVRGGAEAGADSRRSLRGMGWGVWWSGLWCCEPGGTCDAMRCDAMCGVVKRCEDASRMDEMR